MECPFPERYMSLKDFERDLLVTLAVNGPASGPELWNATGEIDGRTSDVPMYEKLDKLADLGYVEKHEYERDGRTHEFEATSVGKAIVDRAKEGLEG